ncbi:hypothetical protein EV702DRAFT_1045519 [Suillus placidus]|uniref:Uncharacterized protein n=1 Tax=Suillus placidus TaxID=48579 RepID=A0A9P7D1U4_9AGAM|nr:hypothetical protein EV702DRAFT_1045519 [Suillus placidus]
MNELHAPKVLINETTTAEMSTSQASPQSPTRDLQNTQLTPTITGTPFKQGSSTKLPWTTNAHCWNLTIDAMGAEMKDHCVGLVIVKEFLTNLPALTFKSGIFNNTIHVKKELQAYEPFIAAIQSFGPALSFVNTSASQDTDISATFSFTVKPDISVYADGTSHGCNVSTAEVIIKFKWDAIHDAFCDTMKGIDTLGQITSYAAAQLGAQYRTHLISILIVETFARIIRYMEGAIVTHTFNYNKDPHLADFFRCFSQVLPALHGVDTSVTPASSEEAIRAWLRLNLCANVPMFMVNIPAAEGDGSFRLIIPAPVPRGLSPVCCRTRTCPAFEPVHYTIVMFKDSWWVALPDILPVGVTYKHLKNANVRNVATCIACHDIPSLPQQHTQTLKFANASWACHHGCLIPHIHHRLALNLVGKPLAQFVNSRQVVEAVRDALIGTEHTVNEMVQDCNS